MYRIPVEEYPMYKYDDQDVINAWRWFLSLISEREWAQRKVNIEKCITSAFAPLTSQGDPTKVTYLVVKDALIDWYLYLIDTLINEPHKYEYFQGARILPIFKRFGSDLDALKNIPGIQKRIKELMWKRKSEADAILFEFLTALLWVRNGYQVEFIDEKMGEKTPDFVARKNGNAWYVECKRQSKTADYTYTESRKRHKMISYIAEDLVKRNIHLNITFHVELDPLPDTFLRDLLIHKIPLAMPGKIVSNEQIDIDLAFVDMPKIVAHLDKYSVKYGSPMLKSLIGGDSGDHTSFTWGLVAQLFRVGDGDVHNVFISDISHAYGVYWSCDAKEALLAKARDVKSQVYSALRQFKSEDTAVVHVGLETYDGPSVEWERFEKIQNTFELIDPANSNLRWLFCHFFQAYSPSDQPFVFDETTHALSHFPGKPPLEKRFMIIPDDADTAEGSFHWERESPL
jgi:hypothetical protein